MRYCIFFLALFSASVAYAQCGPDGCPTNPWRGSSPYDAGPQFPGIPAPPKTFDPPEKVQPSAPVGDHSEILRILAILAEDHKTLANNQKALDNKLKTLNEAIKNIDVDVQIPEQSTKVVVTLQQDINTLVELTQKQSGTLTELDKTVALLIETMVKKYDEHDATMEQKLEELKVAIEGNKIDEAGLVKALQRLCKCDPDRVINELKSHISLEMATYHTDENVEVDARNIPLVIYLTMTGDPRCKDSDEAIERKIKNGYNIRVVELSPTDTSVLDVPKAVYFPSGRVIRGSSNIRVFLANLVK